MRMSAAHVEELRALITPLDTDDVRVAYRSGNFPRADKVKDLNMRYRWDLFWAAKGYDHGYNDAHIDTALRRIVPAL